MGKIELTPVELINQSSELSMLAEKYESLFSSVGSILTTVNSGWSEVLSNNFEGKITAAQKSFTGIVSALANGADIANKSAVSFEDVDKLLAKVMGDGKSASGENPVSGEVASVSEYFDLTSEEVLEELRNKILEEIGQNEVDTIVLKELYEAVFHPESQIEGLYEVYNMLRDRSYECWGNGEYWESLKYAGKAIGLDVYNRLYQFSDGALEGLMDIGEEAIDTIGSVRRKTMNLNFEVLDGVTDLIPGNVDDVVVDQYQTMWNKGADIAEDIMDKGIEFWRGLL